MYELGIMETKTIKINNEVFIKLWRYHAERRSEAFKRGDLTQLSYSDTINYLIEKTKEIQQ